MMTETGELCSDATRALPATRKGDLGLWQIAADLMAQHGPAAEQEAVRLANLMLERGDRERQVEWLRVWTVIVLLSSEAIQEAAE
jgi:hypothetical protein